MFFKKKNNPTPTLWWKEEVAAGLTERIKTGELYPEPDPLYRLLPLPRANPGPPTAPATRPRPSRVHIDTRAPPHLQPSIQGERGVKEVVMSPLVACSAKKKNLYLVTQEYRSPIKQQVKTIFIYCFQLPFYWKTCSVFLDKNRNTFLKNTLRVFEVFYPNMPEIMIHHWRSIQTFYLSKSSKAKYKCTPLQVEVLHSNLHYKSLHKY